MFLSILQIIVCGLLIAAIVIQNIGGGLSTAFGGGGEMYRSKRSVEKLLIYATIVLAALFAILSILLLLHP